MSEQTNDRQGKTIQPLRTGKVAIEWITDQYEWSHGRKPRGYGHWYFVVRKLDGMTDMTFNAHGTLAESKQVVKTQVQRAYMLGLLDRNVRVEICA